MKFIPQPWMTSLAIKRIFDAVPHSEETLRFVGGCVRDAIIGKPVQDIDLATSYKPEEMTELLEKAGIKVVPTGIAHGTIMAVIDGQGFEITTLRRDEETDGRHAVVSFTDDCQEDAARRDFTFNALYLSRSGEIYDPWGGVQDLNDGVVRFIGEASDRIQEDYLRILRYFRFYARFSKKAPDAATLKALQGNAHGLIDISGERIHSELLRLLKNSDPRASLGVMAQTTVLKVITDQNVIPETFINLIDLECQYDLPSSPMTRLYNLINQDAKSLGWILKRYKFSSKESKWLLKLEGMMRTETQDLKLTLHFQGKNHTLAWYLSRHAQGNQKPQGADFEAILNFEKKEFPVTGQDLLAEGIKPGPDLGKELKRRERNWVLKTY